MLDRPDDRGRGPGVADVAQPGEPVRPVEQVGVPLIGAEGLDEQSLPVIGDRHERPGALGLRPRPARRRLTGRPADRSAAAIPSGPIRRSGTPNATSTAGTDGHPGGEREDQFGRQDSAGDQPGRRHGSQRDPCRPAPGTAQPRRCGHGDRHRRGEQGRAGKRRAGQPRAVPGSGRYRGRVLAAGQVQDARQRGTGRGGAGRQAGQQAEPAVAQGSGDDRGGRDDEGHLHQAGQQPSGRVRSEPGHGGRAGTEQPAGSHRDGCEHPGQHQSADDQADDIARMTVTRRRQKPPGCFVIGSGAPGEGSMAAVGGSLDGFRSAGSGPYSCRLTCCFRRGGAAERQPGVAAAAVAAPVVPSLEQVRYQGGHQGAGRAEQDPGGGVGQPVGRRGRRGRAPSGSRTPPRPRPTGHAACPRGTRAMTAATTVTDAAIGMSGRERRAARGDQRPGRPGPVVDALSASRSAPPTARRRRRKRPGATTGGAGPGIRPGRSAPAA